MNTQVNDNYSLRDIFAATPLGRKGKEALRKLGVLMTPEEFVSDTGLYVEPHKSNMEKPLPVEDRNYPSDEYIIETDYSEFKKTWRETKKYSRLELERKDFEDSLKKDFTKAIYQIKGSAGCGKTTYFHRIQYEMSRNNSNYQFYFCDLEKSTSSFQFLNVYTEFDRYNNVWIFVGFILSKTLHEIFCKETHDNNNNDITHKFVKEITDIYKQYLHNPSSDSQIKDPDKRQSEIFAKLGEYVSSDINRDKFFNEFGNFITDEIKRIKNNPDIPEATQKEAVEFVVGFIIRMFFCLSKIKNTRYICAIDSVEHYVNTKQRLKNKEISIIVNGIKLAADRLRPRIDEMDAQSYSPFYAIVIMMRDTSETITENTQQQNGKGHKDTISVDISEWFDFESIIDRREEFFKSKIQELEKNKLIKEVFDNVIHDKSTYRWGLHGLITRMYNHNYRTFTDCLIDALSVKSNAELSWFNKKWNEAKAKHLSYLKNMCRQYIFRLLLDYIEETKYFDDIMVAKYSDNYMGAINVDAQQEKTSYARRIATILNNWFLENGKKFASFPYLVDSVLASHEACTSTPKQIDDLVNILCIMEKPDTDETNWSALIEIKLDPEQSSNEEDYSKALKVALEKEWNDNKDKPKSEWDSTKYGIRIRNSGRFFADFIPEFEYFACRSASFGKYVHYPPLFELANLKKDKSGFYPCIQIIQGVHRQSIDCLDNVINREKSVPKAKLRTWLFKRYKNANAETHPLRIFQQQIGYLEKYSDYVRNYTTDSDYITDNECSNQDRSKIIELIDKAIEKYKDELEIRKKNNPNYFNLGRSI